MKKIGFLTLALLLVPCFSLAISLEDRCNLDGGKVYGNECMFDLNEILLGGAGNNFCSLGNYFNGNCKRPENKDFSQEMIAAYNWSYSKGITTMETIKQANTDKEITRAELAKMISNYAKNAFGKTLDTTKTCLFLNSNVSADLVQYMTESCQLGLMGQGITDFRPNDSVTRAEFGTVLSRMLFDTEDGTDKYYSTHLAKLKSEGIISNDNPDLKELRGFVMLMLMRSDNNYEGELAIIGPNSGYDDKINQGELVLKGNFEDHTDYIFFASGNWQNYLYKNSVYPGEKVNFQGKVKSIDGAAGSHYYEVETIYKLEDNNEGDIHLCRGIYDTKDIEGESCDENIKDVVCADDGKEYVNSDCACTNSSVYSFTFGKCNNYQLGEALTLSNMNHFTKVFSGGYLYRNLRLTNELDQKEYEQLQNDRNMILDYQTKTSAALNKFIDIINKDLLDSCKQYGRNYDSMTGTMDERNTCVDNYINGLYTKLKSELETPRSKYLGDDPVLLSYYNDLKGDHPFIRYFIDLYKKLGKKENEVSLPEYPYIGPITKNPNGGYMSDEEKGGEIADKNGTGFYTYGAGNIGIDGIPETLDVITSIASGIVINGQMLDRIKREYGYVFPIYNDDIMYGTSPLDGPILLHINDGNNDFIYQILGAGAGSGEFLLIVWMLKDGIRVPVGQCGTEGFVLYPRYPTLFGYDDKGSCKGRINYDPLTIFTQEYNLYEGNSIWDMAWNFTSFLRALESTRVLSK